MRKFMVSYSLLAEQFSSFTGIYRAAQIFINPLQTFIFLAKFINSLTPEGNIISIY